jgi:hypothetical protein
MAPSPERIPRLTSRGRVPPRCSGAVVLLAIAGASCSAPPTLTAVLPDTGYPRQLLAVDGTTLFASVVWDIGGPTEAVLYNGLLGTSYFQIPANAAAGDYPVAIRVSGQTSQAVQVTVLQNPSTTFPDPRIEDVGILAVSGAGPADVALTVAAANLDVDATVTVTETVAGLPVAKTVAATFRWGAIPVDYLQKHMPDTFGYPIYHYTQLVSVVENVALGSTLQVTVTNTDGRTASEEYRLPVLLSDLDGDGDGLQDSWESNVYTAPSGNTVALAAMGTRASRKDVLLEVDWIADAQPMADLWQRVEAIFENAPVLNPDGSRGVHIIIDRGQGGLLANGGQTLADHDFLTFGPSNPTGGQNIQGFFSYKATNFDPDRLHLFHYAILGREDLQQWSGRAERFGNDFFLTGLRLPWWTDLASQVSYFVHELGHNLGFSHGDLRSDDQNYDFKPNLPSVMNYNYINGGVDVDCDMVPDEIYTYSEGTLKSLSEASVDEMLGVCDEMPVDMNYVDVGGFFVRGDGRLTSGALDIIGDGDTDDTTDDFDQWGNLLLDFDDPDSDWDGN